jgi:hypothetical protein
MANNPFPSITPASNPHQAAKPSSGTGYKPDALSSGSATQTPLKSGVGPVTGSIVPTLLRLAMRRIPGVGHAMTANTQAVKNPVTAGSHGSIK